MENIVMWVVLVGIFAAALLFLATLGVVIIVAVCVDIRRNSTAPIAPHTRTVAQQRHPTSIARSARPQRRESMVPVVLMVAWIGFTAMAGVAACLVDNQVLTWTFLGSLITFFLVGSFMDTSLRPSDQ